MVFNIINKHKRAVRVFAAFMAFNLFVELLMPLRALALTGGPSQPEVQSFEPVSANQMVDPFTGDFTYNIPLLDVGGYPINISYHAGPSLDEEASWVGLGWNINPGVINRNMRGIPDDFWSPKPDIEDSGNDYIKRISKMKPSRTFSLNYTPSNEIFSKKTGQFLTLGIEYNNYKGFGFSTTTGSNKGAFPFSLSFDSQNGLGVNLDIRKILYDKSSSKALVAGEYASLTETTNTSFIGNASISINSRQGIQSLGLGLQKDIQKQLITRIKHPLLGFTSTFAGGVSTDSKNGSVSLGFLNSSYVPATTSNSYNLSINLSLEFGKEFYGINPDSKIGVIYNQSGVMEKDWGKKYPVYGFLNHSQVENDYNQREDGGHAIMDYNAYGRNMLTKSEVELPYTVLTHDILSVSGQGISGTYCAYSSMVGTVYDQKAENIPIPPLSLGIDLGVSATAKFGVDVGSGYFRSKSGRWEKDNDMFDQLKYSNTRSGADFEQVYFKNIGERTSVDRNYFDAVDWDIAARPEMEKDFLSRRNNNSEDKFAFGIKLKNNLKTWVNDPAVTAPIIRQKRDKRNQVITTLNAREATLFGLIKYRSPNAKDHHIGQITAVNPDGSRYIYAQPAYNTVQKEYTFSFDDRVGGRTLDANGLAWFLSGDHSESNDLTLEHYFDYQETPAYAHSYLLNAVVSADYMDLSNDGPSPDDNGSYTQIKYKKLLSIYKWRTPYATSVGGKYSAFHQEGLKCDDEDDKASFIYGEKELFYMDTVKTKTHIAIFYTSGREDGLGVDNELGGAKNTSVRLQKLDSIYLFTTNEFYNTNPLNRQPLKVVYFEYDYSLCSNVPNNSGAAVVVNGVNINANKGKLTLNKIWFKYGNSSAGALSPYQFFYTNNYDYGYKSYDRWGNYKPVPGGTNPPNDEFPYTEQNNPSVDEYVAGWSLSSITLPSGGNISITYEADDYAYVQNRTAMEMFKIAGFGHNDNFSGSSNLLYENNGLTQNNYVFFNLRSPSDQIAKYLPQPSPIDNKRYLYINAYVKLTTDISSVSHYEYVRCYAEIIGSGLCSDGIHGFIQIKKSPLNETIGISYGDVNPVSKNAWQFLRLNAPHLVYPGQNVMRDKGQNGISLNDVYSTAYTILSVYPELAKTIVGFNTTQMINNRGNEVTLPKSWIRLQSPELKKKGGGYRVKMITVDNKWSTIATGEESQQMGQVYDYSIEDSETARTVSSGVASYEPQLGGDENPLRQPSFYATKKLASLGQEDYFFNDMPLGESIYPSAMVGYRQVKVRNIKPKDINSSSTETITRHGTGYSTQKFFTAYDFPVKANKTRVDAEFKKSPILAQLGFSMEIAGATQGFSIELNDMHGKPKSMESYDEFGNLITKTEYHYKTSPTNARELNNNVTTLKGDGTIDRDAIVGYEIETVMHPSQLEESGINVHINTDADVFFIGALPVITTGFGGSISGSYKSVKTATATKVVNRYGILESVTVTDQSSSVTTKNVAFDDETGEVLLTETTNEFNNTIYNFSYPSHWTYDRMGPAYKNSDAFFTGLSVNSGSGMAIVLPTTAQYLIPGDELIAETSSGETLVWVLDKELSGTGPNYEVSFIDRNGAKLANGTYNMRVIRSGRRNMQAVPVGKIVSNDNPVPISGSSFLDGSGEVLLSSVINTSAASFSDQWQTYRHDPGCWESACEDPVYDRIYDQGIGIGHKYCFLSVQSIPHKFVEKDEIINPFLLGVRGNWRSDYTYVYYDRDNTTFKRQQTNTGSYPYTAYGAEFNGTNVPADGKLTTFKPFWYYSGGSWKNRGLGTTATGNNPWIWNSKANQINPDGVELENKNALEIYSSAIYSYANKQPIAVTYNAGLRQTLYEGFEDYPAINYNVLGCDTPQYPAEVNILTQQFKKDPIASNLVNIPQHWYFWPMLHNFTMTSGKNVSITTNEAHTGKNAIRVTKSGISVPTQVYSKTGTNNSGSQPLDGAFLSEYKINPVDLTDIFSPDYDSTKYLLTYWVKASDLSQASITITRNGGSTLGTTSLIAESPEIEGWVKREYVVDISLIAINTGDIIEVNISNAATTDAFFDDIRIHPFDANMKSFVYDNRKLRLMATLDENNYATFFEYDEEGNLVRTKRETERGIITISENRQNIKH